MERRGNESVLWPCRNFTYTNSGRSLMHFLELDGMGWNDGYGFVAFTAWRIFDERKLNDYSIWAVCMIIFFVYVAACID